jgi:cytochrome c oxidase subunit II
MDTLANWFQTHVLRLPFLASEHGGDIDSLLTYIHWLMFLLFFGWLVYFFYALARFRQSRQARADAVGLRSHVTGYLEIAVVVIEAVLLIGFSIPLWAKRVSGLPPEDEATVVRVMGRQFNWMAHYAGPDGVMGRQDPALSSASDPFGLDRKGDEAALDDVVVQGTIVVPVNRPVVFHVTSIDVIHSLAIKSMRICQDAIPGMSIPVWFTPVKEGDYMITCAQLCGNSHYGMFGTLRVVSQAEYDSWLLTQSNRARSAAGQPVDYE